MFDTTNLDNTVITREHATGSARARLAHRSPGEHVTHYTFTLNRFTTGQRVTIGVSDHNPNRSLAPRDALESYAQDALSMRDCAAQWGDDAALAWATEYEDVPVTSMSDVHAWRDWFTHALAEAARFEAWLPEGVTLADVADVADAA